METDATSAKRSRLPDSPLLIAARTGILEIVEEILEVYPQALEHINQNGQNILHFAIMHRQHKIFDLVTKKPSDRLLLGIDNDGCTILHCTAEMRYFTDGTSTTAALNCKRS
ncbi:uncharacterized protein LOC111274036 [Durio zibethinus]|uniref:Uncharacterized protein LOC111274036 n=1 Tax=Durio zibethinus TaxID=66656 RepID=A0A6P5WEH2_DURZI|nr:uncharacterized protein LOC111274036 [Durio zibethinus]